jgi:HlyD family secretion protein
VLNIAAEGRRDRRNFPGAAVRGGKKQCAHGGRQVAQLDRVIERLRGISDRHESTSEPADAAGGESLWLLRGLARRPGMVVLVLAAAALAVAAGWRARGPAVPTTVVARMDLEQHLVASGRVRVVTRVEIAAEASGRVTAVRIREGERARAGALIVQLDDREARAAVAQARAAVARAAARVEGLRDVSAVVASESVREAEVAQAQAEDDLARLELLLKGGAVARAEVDEARRRVEIARARSASARAEAGAARPQGAETRAAGSEQRQAEAQLASALARLDDTRVLAPHDGVVLTIAVEAGDTVQIGDPIVELAADGETQLVIEPDERHLAWIQPGQRAAASAEPFPGDVFDADVCYVAPAVDSRRGSVEVRLCVDEPPAFLRPDMTVSVDLTVARTTAALTVPTDAVHDASTPAPWVLAVEGGRVVKRMVELGLRGNGHSEIRSGLDEGDEVVAAADITLREGQRVRPRRGGA